MPFFTSFSCDVVDVRDEMNWFRHPCSASCVRVTWVNLNPERICKSYLINSGFRVFGFCHLALLNVLVSCHESTQLTHLNASRGCLVSTDFYSNGQVK